MAVLQANEYDISFFDGKKTALRHNAGYSNYERWRRNDGVGGSAEAHVGLYMECATRSAKCARSDDPCGGPNVRDRSGRYSRHFAP